MSADNWAICPRCKARAAAEKEARIEQARLAYGKVSQEEYAELVERSLEEIEVPTSFREDYEFWGANEGVLHISYSGHCQDCGLALDFQDEKQFFFPDEEETRLQSRG